ncbi:MAG: DUF4340 domain-containing protein [Verrucomicrobia bacterium]|nr:DUF4340 domain-containing protein [Verrucomicrobiota bacterium]
MNFRNTGFLAALALVLLACILLFERRPSSVVDRLVRNEGLFQNFDASTVTDIDLHASNLVLRATRSNDRWQLLTPSYPAQQNRIEEFLESIGRIELRSSMTPDDVAAQETGLSAFGLDPPRATIQLGLGTNQLKLLVGAGTFLEGEIYVRRNDETGIDVVDDSILDHLPESAAQWRNPMLLFGDSISFDRLTVTNGGSVLELEVNSASQLWQMIKPLPARADFAEVNNLLQLLRAARVNHFVTDDPDPDLGSFGLQPQNLDLVLSKGGNRVFMAQFGGNPEGAPALAYARLFGRTNVVLLDAELAEALREPHTLYLDHRLLSIAPRSVERIEIRTRGQFVLERGIDDFWRIVEPFSALADQDAVHRLFDTVTRLRIVGFEKDVVADFSDYGLDPADRQYTFSLRSGSGVAGAKPHMVRIEFSTNQIDASRLDTVFARRSDEVAVYSVPYGDTLRLPLAPYEMRDRKVWDFESGDVIRIAIEELGKTNRISRGPQGEWTADVIANARMEETLHRLASIRATSWTTKGEERLPLYGFGRDSFKITLELANQQETRILRLSDRRAYASVVLEENEPVIFVVPAEVFAFVKRDFKVDSTQTRE